MNEFTTVWKMCKTNHFSSRNRIKQTGTFTKPRVLKRYEIELITDATDGYSVINEQKYYHRVGMMQLCRPGDVRYSYIGHFSAFFIHFICNDQTVQEHFLDVFPRTIYAGTTSRILDLMMNINYLNRNPSELNTIYFTSKMYELMGAIKEQSVISEHLEPSFFQHLESINDTIKYIKANYMKDISLDELAEMASMSRTNYHYIFKKTVGMSPCDYQTYRRVHEAKKMLINTNMSICDIAYAVGCGSQSYFGCIFKKITGMTPLVYRSNNYKSNSNIDLL